MRYFLICFSLFASGIILSQENVSYANCHLNFKLEDKVTRLFLDKNGAIYPEAKMNEELFVSLNYDLEKYYNYQSSSTGNEWESEQDQRAALILERIHKTNSEDAHIFILVHGFRKAVVPINGDISAQEEYDFIREKILSQSKQPVHFLEVYWDGMYLKPEKSLKFVIKLGKMFKKQAKPNATRAGFGLRRVVSKIKNKNITILSHSLGAEVVSRLLFNSSSLSSSLPTPDQNLNIALVAPAISKKIYRNYYNRTGGLPPSGKDNYQLSIFYNETDFVLSKSTKILGIKVSLSRRYGNTRLGCNCGNEAEELDEYFKKEFQASTLEVIEIKSFTHSHLAKSYFGSKEFEEYIKRVSPNENSKM